MKFLVDESLQRHVAGLLVENGLDAVHVSDIGLRGAPDEKVLAAADEDSRILITADTDFGTLLALSGAAQPSVILLRRPGRRSAERAQVVLTVSQPRQRRPAPRCSHHRRDHADTRAGVTDRAVTTRNDPACRNMPTATAVTSRWCGPVPPGRTVPIRRIGPPGPRPCSVILRRGFRSLARLRQLVRRDLCGVERFGQVGRRGLHGLECVGHLVSRDLRSVTVTRCGQFLWILFGHRSRLNAKRSARSTQRLQRVRTPRPAHGL